MERKIRRFWSLGRLSTEGDMAMDLSQMQKAVYENKVEKGFNVTDVLQEFCLL